MEHREPLWELMGLLFKAHPWHGIAIGPHAPRYEVMRRSQEDYQERFGHLADMLTAALRG